MCFPGGVSIVIVGTSGADLQLAGNRLDAGVPVVVPMPSPLGYALAATDAAAVNRAKGRPGQQAAGVAVADLAMLRPHLDLDEAGIELARRLSAELLLNLLLPVDGSGPDWFGPSTKDGWLAATLAMADAVRPLLDQRGHLYLSSANPTGSPVACDAPTADAAFGGRLLVLDGDRGRRDTDRIGSAAIVRVGRGSRLEVVRDGAQTAAIRGDPQRALRRLLS